MAKRLHQYVKYTTEELDSYVDTEGSCVQRINTEMKLSLAPYSMANFKQALMNEILRLKIGYYDERLTGIILDMKNLKVLGAEARIRADDPRMHICIQADVYLFKPEKGAILNGVVKHITKNQVGVILYRVFNVTLRCTHNVNKFIQMNANVKFRINKFNLLNIFPYIDGELLKTETDDSFMENVEKFSDRSDSGIEVCQLNEIKKISDPITINNGIKNNQRTGNKNLLQNGKQRKRKFSEKSDEKKRKKINDSNRKIDITKIKQEEELDNSTGSLDMNQLIKTNKSSKRKSKTNIIDNNLIINSIKQEIDC